MTIPRPIPGGEMLAQQSFLQRLKTALGGRQFAWHDPRMLRALQTAAPSVQNPQQLQNLSFWLTQRAQGLNKPVWEVGGPANAWLQQATNGTLTTPEGRGVNFFTRGLQGQNTILPQMFGARDWGAVAGS